MKDKIINCLIYGRVSLFSNCSVCNKSKSIKLKPNLKSDDETDIYNFNCENYRYTYCG